MVPVMVSSVVEVSGKDGLLFTLEEKVDARHTPVFCGHGYDWQWSIGI